MSNRNTNETIENELMLMNSTFRSMPNSIIVKCKKEKQKGGPLLCKYLL